MEKLEIKPIENAVLEELVKETFDLEDCNCDDDLIKIRTKLYKSKYEFKGLEEQEKDLRNYLRTLVSNKFRLEEQGKYYERVKINYDKFGYIVARLYIAPNPTNMHEIIKKLVSKFVKKDIPVYFKYQLLSSNKEECDRIVIYLDSENREATEEIVKNVYDNNPLLFKDSERSVMWLYESKVKGIYLTPETPGDAYSVKFIESILEAKKSFDYLDNTFNYLKIDKKDFMETLILESLFRNKILLSKDNNIITIKKYTNSFF